MNRRAALILSVVIFVYFAFLSARRYGDFETEEFIIYIMGILTIVWLSRASYRATSRNTAIYNLAVGLTLTIAGAIYYGNMSLKISELQRRLSQSESTAGAAIGFLPAILWWMAWIYSSARKPHQ